MLGPALRRFLFIFRISFPVWVEIRILFICRDTGSCLEAPSWFPRRPKQEEDQEPGECTSG